MTVESKTNLKIQNSKSEIHALLGHTYATPNLEARGNSFNVDVTKRRLV